MEVLLYYRQKEIGPWLQNTNGVPLESMEKQSWMEFWRGNHRPDWGFIDALLMTPVVLITSYQCVCWWCRRNTGWIHPSRQKSWAALGRGGLFVCLQQQPAPVTDRGQMWEAGCPKAEASLPVPMQECLRKPSKAISLPAGSPHKWARLNKIRAPLSFPDPWRHQGRNHCRLSCIPALIYD